MVYDVPKNAYVPRICKMFPKDTYILFDRHNLEDMYNKILLSIENKKETREKIDILHKFVIDKHNHSKRARDLRKIVKKYV